MPATDKPDTGDATTSTSANDASTTEGRTAALGAEKPAVDKPADPTRIVIEQAPAEPAVFYGEGNATDPEKPHVQADYQPFEW